MRNMQTAATFLLVLSGGPPAFANDVWHATRTLLPGDVVRSDDIAAHAPVRPVIDAVPATHPVVGLEVKRRIYDGRAFTERDIGPRSAVKSNMQVQVLWKAGALSLAMAGRAMEAGAVGDQIRVLNPATARTIRGVIVGDGVVEMGEGP